MSRKLWTLRMQAENGVNKAHSDILVWFSLGRWYPGGPDFFINLRDVLRSDLLDKWAGIFVKKQCWKERTAGIAVLSWIFTTFTASHNRYPLFKVLLSDRTNFPKFPKPFCLKLLETIINDYLHVFPGLR